MTVPLTELTTSCKKINRVKFHYIELGYKMNTQNKD